MATIEIQQSVLTGLAAQAERQGVSLDAYLAHLAGLHLASNGKSPHLTGEELERLLDSEASSDSTYEGTYPRADIYRNHD